MLAKWGGVDSVVKTKVKQNLLPVLGAQVHICTTVAIECIAIQACTTPGTSDYRQHQPGILQPLWWPR